MPNQSKTPSLVCITANVQQSSLVLWRFRLSLVPRFFIIPNFRCVLRLIIPNDIHLILLLNILLPLPLPFKLSIFPIGLLHFACLLFLRRRRLNRNTTLISFFQRLNSIC